MLAFKVVPLSLNKTRYNESKFILISKYLELKLVQLFLGEFMN